MVRRLFFANMILASNLVAMLSIASETQLVLAEIKSNLVPGPVEYAAIVPKDRQQRYPLILMLHGGSLSHDILVQGQSRWERWLGGRAVVVTPSAKRSFYLDFKDGSEQWETFILGPFLKHLRETLPIGSGADDTFVMGVSMGGMGALRMAFKYPKKFSAVAALEPGIQPVLVWEEVQDKHRFFWSDEILHRSFGEPIDPNYWADNHPPTLGLRNARVIRESGIRIYLEAGDRDELWLYEGAEYLHQLLWQQKIRHEYHLVTGAGHIGASLNAQRIPEAIEFLLRKPDWDALSPAGAKAIGRLSRGKAKLKTQSHYPDD